MVIGILALCLCRACYEPKRVQPIYEKVYCKPAFQLLSPESYSDGTPTTAETTSPTPIAEVSNDSDPIAATEPSAEHGDALRSRRDSPVRQIDCSQEQRNDVKIAQEPEPPRAQAPPISSRPAEKHSGASGRTGIALGVQVDGKICEVPVPGDKEDWNVIPTPPTEISLPTRSGAVRNVETWSHSSIYNATRYVDEPAPELTRPRLSTPTKKKTKVPERVMVLA